MKQLLILFSCLLFAFAGAQAQNEFTHAVNGIKRIEMSTGTNVRIVQGTTNEIKIKETCVDCEEDKSSSSEQKDDDRAKGLKAIYPGGVDNTGLGFSVQQDGDVLKINDLKSYITRKGILISLPSSVALSLHCSPLGNVTVESVAAELEITTNTGYIKLKNVTGPVTAHTSTGTIEADFSALSQEAPTSISSSTGVIDVTLPASTKASVELRSVTGGVFSNFDLVKPREDGLKPISGHKSIEGNLNNGGVKLSIKASTGNIYLRKK